MLNAPVLAGNVGKDARPVYHLAISAAKTDRLLSDAEWADVAAEYLYRIGLAPRGDDEAVRWVAVRHAPDHIHLVATLVRQDGRPVFPRQDFLRSREASPAVEDRYGLTTTAPVGGTSTPETTRGEWRKHRQNSDRRHAQARPAPVGPDRQVLRARVRDAVAGSRSWEEFTGRLSDDGVLVRPRFSTVNPSEITGYAVALRPVGHDLDDVRPPVWFGGGKLAPDMTLPRLQQRWLDDPTGEGSGRSSGQRDADRPTAALAERMRSGGLPTLTDGERQNLWAAARRAVRGAQHALEDAAVTGGGNSPSAQVDAMAAAMGASDILHRQPPGRRQARRTAARGRRALRPGQPPGPWRCAGGDAGQPSAADSRPRDAERRRRQAPGHPAAAATDEPARQPGRDRRPSARDPTPGRTGPRRTSGRRTASRPRRPGRRSRGEQQPAEPPRVLPARPDGRSHAAWLATAADSAAGTQPEPRATASNTLTRRQPVSARPAEPASCDGHAGR